MHNQVQYSLPLEPLATRREDMNSADQELITRAIRCLETHYLVKRDVMNSPDVAESFVRLHLAGVKHEIFAVLWLDTRLRLIVYEELFRGTIDGASVHPREVVRQALKHNASNCILVHNHPSGVPDPSQSDLRITETLRNTLSLIDVAVTDHLIVGAEGVVSMATRGLL